MSTERKASNLVQLKGGSGPDDEYIKMLEEHLEAAKKGEFIGGIVVACGPGGQLKFDDGGIYPSGDIILGMRELERQILDDEFGSDKDDDGPE